MEEDVKNKLEFGVSEEYSFEFRSSRVHSISKRTENDYIVATNKNIFFIKDEIIFKKYDFPSTAMIYIDDLKAIVITTHPPTKARCLFMGDLLLPTDNQGTDIDQMGVCHLFYAPKSQTIVSVGVGIKTFKFSCSPLHMRSPIDPLFANFHLRSKFALNYSATYMTKPSFIQDKEIIVLATSEGILTYDLDGNLLQPILQKSFGRFTMFSYNEKTKKCLTYGEQLGLALWGSSGTLIKAITMMNTLIIFSLFIDNEFVILIDSNDRISLFDIKTCKLFPFLKPPGKPSNITLLTGNGFPRLCVSYSSMMIVYKIVIPWHLWRTTATTVMKIDRCPALRRAARIALQLRDLSIQLISPKTRKMVTLCHTKNLGILSDCLVDRGVDGNLEDRDLVFATFTNGSVCVFQTDTNPSEPKNIVKVKATCTTISMFMGQMCFIVGTEEGVVILYSYEKLNFIRRFQKYKEKMYRIFAHKETQSLITVHEDHLLMFSTETGKYITQYDIKYGSVCEFIWDLYIVGYDNGSINIIKIIDNGFSPIYKETHSIHQGKVTSISRGQSHFITTGIDGNAFIWNRNCECIFQLVFPLPLLSSAFYNGTRSILLGLDKDVMFVPGTAIFGNEVDLLEEEIDNFDLLEDVLIGDPSDINDEDFETKELDFLKEFQRNAEKEKQKQKAKKAKMNKRLRYITSLSEDKQLLDELMLKGQNPENSENSNLEQATTKNEMTESEREEALQELMDITNSFDPNRTMQTNETTNSKQNKNEENQKEKEEEEDVYEYEEEETDSDYDEQNSKVNVNQIDENIEINKEQTNKNGLLSNDLESISEDSSDEFEMNYFISGSLNKIKTNYKQNSNENITITISKSNEQKHKTPNESKTNENNSKQKQNDKQQKQIQNNNKKVIKNSKEKESNKKQEKEKPIFQETQKTNKNQKLENDKQTHKIIENKTENIIKTNSVQNDKNNNEKAIEKKTLNQNNDKDEKTDQNHINNHKQSQEKQIEKPKQISTNQLEIKKIEQNKTLNTKDGNKSESKKIDQGKNENLKVINKQETKKIEQNKNQNSSPIKEKQNISLTNESQINNKNKIQQEPNISISKVEKSKQHEKVVKFDTKPNQTNQEIEKTKQNNQETKTENNNTQNNTKIVPRIPIRNSYGSSPRFSSKHLLYEQQNSTGNSKIPSQTNIFPSTKPRIHVSITPRPSYINKYVNRNHLLPPLFSSREEQENEQEKMKGVIKKRTSEYAINKQKILEGRALAYSTPMNEDDHLWMLRPQTIAQKQKYSDLVAIFRQRRPSPPIFQHNKKL